MKEGDSESLISFLCSHKYTYVRRMWCHPVVSERVYLWLIMTLKDSRFVHSDQRSLRKSTTVIQKGHRVSSSCLPKMST